MFPSELCIHFVLETVSEGNYRIRNGCGNRFRFKLIQNRLEKKSDIITNDYLACSLFDPSNQSESFLIVSIFGNCYLFTILSVNATNLTYVYAAI